MFAVPFLPPTKRRSTIPGWSTAAQGLGSKRGVEAKAIEHQSNRAEDLKVITIDLRRTQRNLVVIANPNSA